jgi:hypothetical protein
LLPVITIRFTGAQCRPRIRSLAYGSRIKNVKIAAGYPLNVVVPSGLRSQSPPATAHLIVQK